MQIKWTTTTLILQPPRTPSRLPGSHTGMQPNRKQNRSAAGGVN